MHWRHHVIVLAALALLLAACGDDDEDTGIDLDDELAEEPTPDDEDDGEATPEPTPTPTPTPDDDAEDDAEAAEDDEADADGAQHVTVYVVRAHDGGLWLESERRPLDEPTQAVAEASMVELLTQPTIHPALEPPAGTGATVHGVALDDGLLTVDVSSGITDVDLGADGEAVVQQAIAHTGAQFDTVDEVALLVDGEEVDELWGHLDWSAPFAPEPERLGHIDVETPQWGQAHPQGEPLTVAGTSLTFESTVELDLIDPDGSDVAVDDDAFTTAEQPDIGVRGPFEHTFSVTPDAPGTWTVIARAPDPSGGEGGEPYYVEVELEVQ